MDENRFAPPGAVVDDVGFRSGDVQPIKLWPPSGRIGRLRLLAYSVGLYLAFVVVTIVLGLVAGVGRTNSIPLFVIETVVYVVFSALLLIQRSHDMNFSGWWSLASIIPLVEADLVGGPRNTRRESLGCTTATQHARGQDPRPDPACSSSSSASWRRSPCHAYQQYTDCARVAAAGR